MVGWHHQLSGHEFEQTQGDSEGQGSLVCCSPWVCKESENNLLTKQQQMLFTPTILTLKKFCSYFPVLSQPFIMEAVSSFHLECFPYIVYTIY